MLENDFYTIQQTTQNDTETIFSVRINSEHSIFEGHFPGKPVTPGVVQMEMVKELSGKAVGKDLEMVSMANCKFLAFMDPNEAPELDIVIKTTETEEGNSKVAAQIKNSETLFLKISAVYK